MIFGCLSKVNITLATESCDRNERMIALNALQQYLRDAAEPALRDFEKNPNSMRHAFQACVATYHAIDRAVYPRKPGNLRKEWGARSVEFRIVDMIAHKFKHVMSDDEKAPPQVGAISLSRLVFGKGTLNSSAFNTTAIGDGGIDLYNLYFVIRDAIK